MKIIEENILYMVNQNVQTTENLHFKIMVKPKEKVPIFKGEESVGSNRSAPKGKGTLDLAAPGKMDAD